MVVTDIQACFVVGACIHHRAGVRFDCSGLRLP
jgi:hypothetical protein